MDPVEFLTHYFLQPWILLLIGALTLLYFYLTWDYDYWKKQGIKGDKPRLILGTLRDPMNNAQEVQDMEMYKKYGRIFGMYEGSRPALMVADPDLLKTIFVKDFHAFRNRRDFPTSSRDTIIRSFLSVMVDDDWKELRNIVTPTFTTGKLKQMLYLIEECGQNLVKKLRQYADKKEPVEMKTHLCSFTMDVIATCAFGTKLDSLNDPESEFVRHARNAFNDPPKTIILAFLFPWLAEYLPPFISRESLEYFKDLLDKVIEAKQNGKVTRRDFLQLLMDAKVESDKEHQENKESSKFVMTHLHVVAQAILFLLAGFETTAITLSFTLYSLMVNEDIQEKLITEIDEFLKRDKGTITYESLSEMQYTDMVISETLRMYPAVVRLERSCEEEGYVLDGITLRKGMLIGIPSYCMHYDEEFFPNPTKFDPERFSPENRAKMNPYTYLPFGFGLRNCVGMRFALLELKLTLVLLLSNFRIKKCDKTQIPYQRAKKSGFLQIESLLVLLEPR